MKFPTVTCERHRGQASTGYAVCHHVARGAVIAHVQNATDDDLGEILCAECVTRAPDLTPDDLILACSQCAAEIRGHS